MPKVNPIPEGYHALTPSLCVKDTRKAMAFYKKAFGAVPAHDVCEMPDGKIGHAELQIGDSRLMLSDEFPEFGCVAPQGQAVSSHLYLYVKDVDALYKTAVAAGVKTVMPLTNQFWGDRMAVVVDPFGHRWSLSSHVEDVTPEQMKERMEKQYAAPAGK
jgi:PhnB protein